MTETAGVVDVVNVDADADIVDAAVVGEEQPVQSLDPAEEAEGHLDCSNHRVHLLWVRCFWLVECILVDQQEVLLQQQQQPVLVLLWLLAAVV